MKAYAASAGTQAISRNIEDGSFSGILFTESSCPEWAADLCATNTQMWFRPESQQTFIDTLNEEFSGKASFCFSGFQGGLMLEIIAE